MPTCPEPPGRMIFIVNLTDLHDHTIFNRIGPRTTGSFRGFTNCHARPPQPRLSFPPPTAILPRDMKIHEYQSRKLLADAGIPVPPAEVAMTADEAADAFKKFGGQMCVVKAQVYAGGRGKAGFVKLVKTADEARDAA